MFENIAKDVGLATEQDAAKNIGAIETKVQADVQADITQILTALKPVLTLASTIQDALTHGKLIISIEVGKK